MIEIPVVLSFEAARSRIKATVLQPLELNSLSQNFMDL